MRLGLVIYGSLATVSGGYLYDRQLVEHLRRAGDDVEIIPLRWRNYAGRLTDNFSAGLTARLQGPRYDVLMQDELNHPSLFWLNRRLRRATPYPIITIVHHLRCSERRPAWENVLYRAVERAYLRTVDGFIFNSQTTHTAVEALIGPVAADTCQVSEDLTGVGGVKATRSRLRAIVAHPAGDHFRPLITREQIEARVRQSGPLQLLFIGNVIPRNGLHTLLDALASLPRADWHLHVVGSLNVDPAYGHAIRRRIAQLQLTAQVTLHGALADAGLRQRLERSHLLAVPSTYEGFGIVYLEGMGFGLPALATTAGAAGEIITSGENGYLAPPNDSAALAQTLRLMLDDREHLLSLSLAARRRYEQHPTWEASAARIRAFLVEARRSISSA